MQIKGIEHYNQLGDQKDVVISINLNNADRKIIHDKHLKSSFENYELEDISMLAFVRVKDDIPIAVDTCYYPSEQGEIEIDFLTKGQEKSFFSYVLKNFIGKENNYNSF